MYVIEVMPLSRSYGLSTLSYFSAERYEDGSIISVPVRNKLTPALVIHTQGAETNKTALKAAAFSLKKLPQQKVIQRIAPATIRSAKLLAQYYACSTGTILHALLPTEIREGRIALPHVHHVEHDEYHTPEIIQADTKDRFIAYRSLVREAFSHSASILVVVPTAAEIEHTAAILKEGIEDRVITLMGTLTKRQLQAAYAKLGDYSKPKLIITNPSYAIIERNDITTVIVEHARSPHFAEKQRPYLDYREVLKVHTKESGRRLIYGDMFPRTEEEALRRDGAYYSYEETPKRLSLPGKLKLINQKDEPDGKKPFKLFDEKIITAIRETRKKRGKVFLLAARRGLAPVVACGDCGFIFRSEKAGLPYSLVRIKNKMGEEERWFVCGVSGERKHAPDTCSECGSWRLRERGIGIQYAHDELSKELGGNPIIIFDHTNAKTYKRACYLRDTFYKTKGVIMIGTPMALPYLTSPYDLGVVVNLDALRSTPTWRAQEESLALLLTMREQTNGQLFVQTRTGSDPVVEHASRGSVADFYTEEINLRKTFGYPPFTRLIHLTWQGQREVAKNVEERVKSILADVDVNYYSAPPGNKNEIIRYGLIRIASTDWPSKPLVQKLRSLPPSVRVMMNPDRVV